MTLHITFVSTGESLNLTQIPWQPDEASGLGGESGTAGGPIASLPDAEDQGYNLEVGGPLAIDGRLP